MRSHLKQRPDKMLRTWHFEKLSFGFFVLGGFFGHKLQLLPVHEEATIWVTQWNCCDSSHKDGCSPGSWDSSRALVKPPKPLGWKRSSNELTRKMEASESVKILESSGATAPRAARKLEHVKSLFSLPVYLTRWESLFLTLFSRCKICHAPK